MFDGCSVGVDRKLECPNQVHLPQSFREVNVIQRPEF